MAPITSAIAVAVTRAGMLLSVVGQVVREDPADDLQHADATSLGPGGRCAEVDQIARVFILVVYEDSPQVSWWANGTGPAAPGRCPRGSVVVRQAGLRDEPEAVELALLDALGLDAGDAEVDQVDGFVGFAVHGHSPVAECDQEKIRHADSYKKFIIRL